MKPYKLLGTILSVKGDCTAGHKVREQIDLTLWDSKKDAARRAPPLCAFFYDMIFPYLAVLQFGGEFPPGTKIRIRFRCLAQTQLIK